MTKKRRYSDTKKNKPVSKPAGDPPKIKPAAPKRQNDAEEDADEHI
jgi:hypothetical protein